MRKQQLLVLSLLFTVLLTYLGLKETDQLTSNLMANFDKVFHVLAYVMLTFLWTTCLWLYHPIFKLNKLFLIIFSTLLVYGIIIEVLQSKFTTTRLFEINDLIANMSGILLGAIFFKFVVIPKLKNK